MVWRLPSQGMRQEREAHRARSPTPSFSATSALPSALCFDAVSGRVLALLFSPGANHVTAGLFHDHHAHGCAGAAASMTLAGASEATSHSR